jgi:hypothetical protein
MHAEAQMGHAVRRYARPETTWLIEEEVVESVCHHAGKPEGRFTVKEP